MKTRLSIQFLLRMQRIGGNQKAPLVCRLVVKNYPRVNFVTGHSIEPERWDRKTHRAIGTDAAAGHINRMLVKLENDLNDIHADLERQGKTVSPKAVLGLYRSLGQAPLDILGLYDKFLEERASLVGFDIADNTQRAARCRRNKAASFIAENKLTGLRPEDFTLNIADKFMQWMLVKQGAERSTAIKHLQSISQVLKWGVRRELVDRNPMQLYEFKRSAAKDIVYLEKEELQRLSAVPLAIPALERVRDCFVFQCWTGLAYADLAALNVERDAEGFNGRRVLRVRRAKSTLFKGYECVIPLLPEAESLLTKYDGQMPVPTNQIYNRYLKQVVELAGLDSKRVTSHVGRKTAGVQMLNAGLPMEIVSKVLGHSSVRMTEKVYAKILDRTVVNEFERVFGSASTPPAPAAAGFSTEPEADECRVLQFRFSA